MLHFNYFRCKKQIELLLFSANKDILKVGKE